ncbi:hypothetical protein [Domibacillus mangrovi]|uniref:hypothetical protein n=1 Tax=Domibacillus mangrovi TaxID=1714354 RepID=UPI000AF7B689|nr:hypothetical protein [Domibacillus mangrovi]
MLELLMITRTVLIVLLVVLIVIWLLKKLFGLAFFAAVILGIWYVYMHYFGL